MASKTRGFPAVSSFLIIIFTALAAQLAGSYHAKSFIIGDSFYALWVVLRIVVPVIVLMALKIPFSRIGLGLPRLDRKMRTVVIAGIVVLIVIFAGIYFIQGYFSHYAYSFGGGSRFDRFASFMVFTASTLTGWEFLHRGFLLMGLRYVLTEREGIREETAVMLAVAVAWIFEVVFHFVKPELEALGLLVGSPILSWLALKTRSIWLPFLFHFLVELLFISALIFR
ncbi:MAG: CPBP family intramembrane metalloprotease [Spirochaetes bacterium]|nr:CPBP family intramembrane metalloprotease [Spirochaetota bacterium]